MAGILGDIYRVLRDGIGVTSPTFKTERTPVSGIGTGVAYTSGDAFGTTIYLKVPKEGTITNVIFLDYDDEGLDKELVLFSGLFTETADNAAFAVSDADLSKCVGVINIATWHNFGNNQVGLATPALGYHVPGGILYAQMVTRGVDNIAADAIPDIIVVVSQ